ncbi:MAG: HIT family protein [Planctomycetota bacterium]
MTDVEDECVACALTKDPRAVPGGRILETSRWHLEHAVAPVPLPGWLILRTIRHTEGITGLDAAEGAELGRLLQLVPQVLKEVTGAERIYVCCFTEVLPHLHIHLIPRAPDEPLRGPQLFVERIAAQREPEDPAATAAAAEIAERVRRGLAGRWT